MQLAELFDKQRKSDEFIIKNRYCEGLEQELTYDKGLFLTNRMLALSVEVSELANELECFKYWKVNTKDNKPKQLEEYLDILFFWLSVGNTLKFTPEEVEAAYLKKYQVNIKRMEENY